MASYIALAHRSDGGARQRRGRAGRPQAAMNSARNLTRAQLEELRAELESERARLERSLAARVGTDGETTPRGARRAPASAESGLAVALESRTLARHQAVVEALRRLEAGTYGICERCQEPIPYGRLVAMPEASHCVSCSLGR